MTAISKFSLAILIILIGYSICFAGTPGWVQKRPVSQAYYIGIAVASKTGDSKNYIQIAKDAALNDLASQIQVNIAGDLMQKIVEKSGLVQDEFVRQIQTSTRAELEGFELVDTYETDNAYWVYYRLSKELYAQQKLAKLHKAASLSLDLFKKAREYENSGSIAKALQFYFQAFAPIETFLAEPLEVDFDGKKIYLTNEIYSSIQNLLANIQLIAKSNQIPAKIGKPLTEPLGLTATFKSPSGLKSAAYNLPIDFSLLKGDADIVGQARTDTNGLATSIVSKIKAMDKIQIINAALDLKAMINYAEASTIMQSLVSSFAPPGTKFVLYVSGPSVYVSSREIHDGQSLAILAVEPALKSGLADKGFTFTDKLSEADIAIDIKAESRDGSEIMQGMYSSFVDMTIAVTDMTSGEEVYKKSFQKIKGIDLSYDKAGLKAFKAAGDIAANEAVPAMLAIIQR